MSVYAASKAFLSSWSESLSFELNKTNHVVTVSPSGTFTGFQKNAGVGVLKAGKGLLTPEYVAKRIVRAMNGKRKVVILGAASRVLICFSRLIPRELNIRLWGFLFAKLR
jgi:short-subunit dehydrogenase